MPTARRITASFVTLANVDRFDNAELHVLLEDLFASIVCGQIVLRIHRRDSAPVSPTPTKSIAVRIAQRSRLVALARIRCH